MTYTKETISFPVERYIDADGKPTCIGDVRNNDACPFLMVSHFGTREHCFWEVSDPEQVHAPVLKRRNDGAGRLIPHCACPIWNKSHV